MAKDPVFNVPALRGAQEQVWLSKDIGTANFFRADAEELLAGIPVTGTKRRSFLQIAGIPIGFAQVGATFDPESAWADAWMASFESAGSQVQCRILDPITLYRENQALTHRRGSPSDRLHFDLLAEHLISGFCMAVGALFQAKNPAEKTEPSKLSLTPFEESIRKAFLSAPPPNH